MNARKTLVALVAVAFASTSGLAVAQPDGRGHDQRGQDERGQDQRGRPDRHDDRRDMRRDDRPGQFEHPAFARGGRLPSEYRNRQYVVDDWRGHRLSAPPRGYHWVQAGGDYVLAAIATGVIASVLLANH